MNTKSNTKKRTNLLHVLLCVIFNIHDYIITNQNPIYPSHRKIKCSRCTKEQVTGNDGENWETANS